MTVSTERRSVYLHVDDTRIVAGSAMAARLFDLQGVIRNEAMSLTPTSAASTSENGSV
jgi:hypothetical protein